MIFTYKKHLGALHILHRTNTYLQCDCLWRTSGAGGSPRLCGQRQTRSGQLGGCSEAWKRRQPISLKPTFHGCWKMGLMLYSSTWRQMMADIGFRCCFRVWPVTFSADRTSHSGTGSHGPMKKGSINRRHWWLTEMISCAAHISWLKGTCDFVQINQTLPHISRKQDHRSSWIKILSMNPYGMTYNEDHNMLVDRWWKRRRFGWSEGPRGRGGDGALLARRKAKPFLNLKWSHKQPENGFVQGGTIKFKPKKRPRHVENIEKKQRKGEEVRLAELSQLFVGTYGSGLLVRFFTTVSWEKSFTRFKQI